MLEVIMKMEGGIDAVFTYVTATNAELSIKCLKAELCLEVAEKIINGRDVRPPDHRVPGAVCVIVYVLLSLEDYLIMPVSEYYQRQIMHSEGGRKGRGRKVSGMARSGKVRPEKVIKLNEEKTMNKSVIQ
jgi:hypothetical protein